MSLLDAEIATLFGSVFGPIYLDGTVTAVTNLDDGMGGDGGQSNTTTACKLQVDACTERQQAEKGYTERDVRVIILQSSLASQPMPGNRVTAKGITYTIGSAIEDPASAYWEIRATPL